MLSTALAALTLLQHGCRHTLPDSPNLYTRPGQTAFRETPEAQRSTIVDVLYVTDRAVKSDGQEGVRYGHARSRSLAWGVCPVEFGDDLTWSELVELSTTRKRGRAVSVDVGTPVEHGRFPETPLALKLENGELVPDADALQEAMSKRIELQDYVRQQLSQTPVKDVYITVHGVKNGFDTSVRRAAELWHLLQRQGLVVAYSWPAGHPGLADGYLYDFTSSRFTSTHLQQLLKALADVPDVERIHLVAHSRGTDVVMSALRDLSLELGEGVPELKIHHVVLLAPDLDFEVLLQRNVRPNTLRARQRTTIYVSTKDEALSASRWLWKSGPRVGLVRYEELREFERGLLRDVGGIDFIDVRVPWDALGHSYFAHPAVTSDLVLLLLEDRQAGAEHGRPLEAINAGYWRLPATYPDSGD